MAFQYPYPGATTLGIKGRDAVVLAAEKRLTYGYFVVSKTVRKVFQITSKIGAACAGFVGDMQNLIRDAQAEINLYRFMYQREPEVRTVAKVLSNYLFSSRFFPYLAETIVGGFDETGGHVLVLDPLGSIIEDDYAVVGSGAEIAIGVIEISYKPNMTAEELRELAIKAVKASISRDAASGNGIDLLIITNDGIKSSETIQV
ncbi:MAG: archaeal proteasome endopeptidase complex subunit beta [Thaumarchaeota archaeon]|jgi:proteasome beta subunit|nr:archaeal proteasome endopeptidase complex subunit beta [Candidatus Geocrenenecus arthurdayi]MCL7390238.1 archaeal proteasome endopeptidase complex subunit beta [Candidatus Geocrenenecus arthurdayi]MCL7390552.1 archaeal proteasome endopeptidase complex subunit beta [Candidatus Geocrenenecus arthurdayi]MCL7396299.1 archaeal proteasome endopeptidase complex subunit beta [Candidatus Geocrenenecus arthurdayi]MCL7401167.1 archaeal proteasome endopeptidase complex subunit beta [Candidatus Geocrenen